MRRSARFIGWAATLLSLSLLVLMPRGSVSALEGEGFKLSDKVTKIKREYPPIAASGNVLTAGSVQDCIDLPFSVLHEVRFDFDKNADIAREITISLSWPAPPEVNDMDIRLFDKEDEVITDSTTADQNPERIKLVGHPNGLDYLCVLNSTGPNTGYTIEASTRTLSGFFERTPEPPTPAPTAESTAPPASAPEPTSAGAATPFTADTPTPEPVETPGPDGPEADKGLLSIGGGKQASPPDDGPRTAQIVFGVLTGLVVLSGGALVALRIRRDVA